MTFDEAVALLGLTVPFTAKDVRRAYLRLLKVHKPETDPEGFMRLRTAYEMFDGIETVTRREDGPTPTAEVEAVAEMPVATPEAHETAGPAEVTEDEPVDDATRPPWDRPVPEDAKVAAALLADWLDRARSDPNAPPPPMSSALRVLWSMLDRRAFKTAGQLYRAMDEWLVHVGGARGQLAWGMTQGLWEMRKEIPEELYSPIVRAVATEELGEAERALRDYAQVWPTMAGGLQRKMEQQAPELAAVFNRYLVAEEHYQPAAIPKRSSWGNYWWAAPVVLGLLRLLTSSSPTVPSYQPDPAAVEERQERLAAIDAARRLETAADANNWVVMAGHARSIQTDLRNNDCSRVHEQIAACYPLLATATEGRKMGIRALIEATEAAIDSRCGPAKKTVDDLLPTPPK